MRNIRHITVHQSGMTDQQMLEGLKNGNIKVVDGAIWFYYDQHHSGMSRAHIPDKENLHVSRRERRFILRHQSVKPA